jgi:hypothetical protein
MTPTQFREAISHLGLSQVGAAHLFGVNPVTARRWAKSGLSGTATILLRLMLAGKISERDVRRTVVEERLSGH